MGSESVVKNKTLLRARYFTVALFLSLAGLLLFAGVSSRLNPTLPQKNIDANLDSLHTTPQKIKNIDLDSLETKSCEPISSIPQKPKEEWRKPIWFATPHFSMPDGTDKRIVNELTRLVRSGKSFYSSIRGVLRHCVGGTETATCSISVAPKHSDSYYNKYFMIVRNPMTLLPYSTNTKSILYHGLEGQLPIEKWREFRKDWFEDMINGWANVFKEWMESGYELGLYIVYEDLMDVKKGPQVLKEMANILNEAGFETVDDDQLRCVWRNALGAEHIQEYHKNGQYEFSDYTPGFSKEEQKVMLEKLETLMTDVKDNVQLVEILKRYQKEIRNNITFD